jgi:hypothetical protein
VADRFVAGLLPAMGYLHVLARVDHMPLEGGVEEDITLFHHDILSIKIGGRTMKAFIDFQRNVPHRVYITARNKTYKVGDGEFLGFLSSSGIDEVYVESAPRKWIYKLLQNGIKVYVLRKHNQNILRNKYIIRKSHENDVRLLYLIYKDDSSYFRRYVKR